MPAETDATPYVRPRDLPIVARCGKCGTGYTTIGWALLHLCGPLRLPEQPVLELRNCGICRPPSTMSIELPGTPTEPAPPDSTTPDEHEDPLGC